jgi:hypothetical protein
MMNEILPNTVFRKAARALGLGTGDRELGDAIRSICRSYLTNPQNLVLPVPRRQITSQLSGIARTVKKLKELLGQCNDGDETDALGQELEDALYVASGARLDHEKLGCLIKELEELEQAARQAIPRVPGGKGGRTPDSEFHALVAKLKGVFERATGKSAGVTWNPYRERYGGKFFRFVSVIEEALAQYRGIRPRSNRALGELLKRATRDRPRRKKPAKGV